MKSSSSASSAVDNDVREEIKNKIGSNNWSLAGAEVVNKEIKPFTIEEVRYIANQLLSATTPVTAINLHNCGIGDEGAKILVEALGNERCEVNDLILEGDNNIGPEGAKALAAILKQGKLKNFKIYGNQIGDEGANALAEALQEEDNKVEVVSLNSTSMTDTGAEKIAEALVSRYCKVTLINISGNEFKEYGKGKLREALKDERCQVINTDIETDLFPSGEFQEIIRCRKTKINDLRHLRKENEELRSEFRKENEELRSQLRKENEELRSEFRKENEELRSQLKYLGQRLGDVESMTTLINVKIDSATRKVKNNLEDALKKGLQDAKDQMDIIKQDSEAYKILTREVANLRKRQNEIAGYKRYYDGVLYEYCSSLLSELEADYCSASVIKSGNVKMEGQEFYSVASGYLAAIVASAPFAGGVLSEVTKQAGALIDHYKNTQEENRLKRILDIGSSTDFAQIALRVAIDLTEKNRQEIIALKGKDLTGSVVQDGSEAAKTTLQTYLADQLDIGLKEASQTVVDSGEVKNGFRVLIKDLKENLESGITKAVSTGLKGLITSFLKENESEAKLLGRLHAQEVIEHLKQEGKAAELALVEETDPDPQNMSAYKTKYSMTSAEIMKVIANPASPTNSPAVTSVGCLQSVRDRCVIS